VLAAKSVAITANKATPVSAIRAQALGDYMRDAKRGTLHQVAYGKWSYNDGENITNGLLPRYKDTNIIWAANESMALGAYNAIKKLSKNNEVIVGGFRDFPDALKSIIRGDLILMVAGHPMIGAWALVLLNDYIHGYDFADIVGAI
jgi:ABC-type sugar transport system substrate-binding protein